MVSITGGGEVRCLNGGMTELFRSIVGMIILGKIALSIDGCWTGSGIGSCSWIASSGSGIGSGSGSCSGAGLGLYVGNLNNDFGNAVVGIVKCVDDCGSACTGMVVVCPS